MRVIVYTRVSRDASGQSRSVGEQETECRRLVEREGWTLVAVESDNDVSASRFARKAREGWQRVVERLAAGEADCLVVWEPSRASRDVVVWGPLLRTCQEHGTKIASNGRLYDPSDPNDYFCLGLEFLMGDRESGMTSKRVQRTTRAQAEQGRPHGALPYGYSRLYEPGRDGPVLVAQVPHPEHAPVVREVVRRLAHGEPLYKIAKDLNDRGVPGPRANGWSPQMVRRMALSRTNIGVRVHKGSEHPGAWEAIVDEGDYWTVVNRLSDPARRTNQGRGARHLLSGLLSCSTCREPLYVRKARSGKAGAYTVYACKRSHTSRKQEPVDQTVSQAVVARLSRPDLLDLISQDDSTERQAAAADVARLRADLDRWYHAAADGKITPDGLAKVEARLLPKIEDAERRARPAATIPPVVEHLAGPQVADAWERLTLDQKREVISTLCKITILSVGKAAKGFDPESVKIDWQAA